MTVSAVPIDVDDPTNHRILVVSEDSLTGFHRDPLGEIARRSGVEREVVVERIRAMLAAGRIRRVRQTLVTTNLAPGALVAWRVPEPGLQDAFDYMSRNDPSSGHLVIRSTDPAKPGAEFRLWTTVKVPPGYSPRKHCEFLKEKTGAQSFRLLPARCVFALGVGHARRRGLEVGTKTEELAEAQEVDPVDLDEVQWTVATAIVREFRPEELEGDLWEVRAREAGVALDDFIRVAEHLDRRKVVGRFTTALEHTKPLPSGERVSKHNGLFHWAAPEGREIEVGRQIGRFQILTHCYWREGGSDFGGANIMAVAHGDTRDRVLAHKAAIDAHLENVGMPALYSNVFWGERSEIKPSEIAAPAYREWCRGMGIDSEQMREAPEPAR
jgi:hypothetical protein